MRDQLCFHPGIFKQSSDLDSHRFSCSKVAWCSCRRRLTPAWTAALLFPSKPPTTSQLFWKALVRYVHRFWLLKEVWKYVFLPQSDFFFFFLLFSGSKSLRMLAPFYSSSKHLSVLYNRIHLSSNFSPVILAHLFPFKIYSSGHAPWRSFQ